jgi:hypothetical protein
MADERSLESRVAKLEALLSGVLESKKRIEQSIPIEHVHSHRMANEVLTRLRTARDNVSVTPLPESCGSRTEVIAQIDSIMKAIELGNQLHLSGCMMCW